MAGEVRVADVVACGDCTHQPMRCDVDPRRTVRKCVNGRFSSGGAVSMPVVSVGGSGVAFESGLSSGNESFEKVLVFWGQGACGGGVEFV